MEEDQELKHACKFCSKSFSSGRSLGGHMRSHMVNDITAQPDGSKLTRKKLPALVSNGEKPDDPEKTRRIEKDKFLISEQQEQEEEQESWASEIDAAAPNRPKRSIRKLRKIMGASADSSSSSISGIDQEQEEVAISLMMLSRDFGGFNSESSDNKNSSGIETVAESVIESPGTELGKRKSSDSDRNRRFECTICNKIFHSYQALGGHKASHKKNKGSRIDSSENSIEIVHLKPELLIQSENFSVDFGRNKSKGIHECPICGKIFPSGQALGGHKRSHLVAEGKNEKNLEVQGPIREFLDLNLPAPSEEDSNGVMGFNQWWIESTQKHESLLGLISN